MEYVQTDIVFELKPTTIEKADLLMKSIIKNLSEDEIELIENAKIHKKFVDVEVDYTIFNKDDENNEN